VFDELKPPTTSIKSMVGSSVISYSASCRSCVAFAFVFVCLCVRVCVQCVCVYVCVCVCVPIHVCVHIMHGVCAWQFMVLMPDARSDALGAQTPQTAAKTCVTKPIDQPI